MVRQANAVDFWRGLALVTIFINHVPGYLVEKFLTHKNYSFSDATSAFVFLAGWSLSYVGGKPNAPRPAGQLFARLWRRALQLYIAQALMVTAVVALLVASAVLLNNPVFADWNNLTTLFESPVQGQIGLALLTYQPWYFDILPLYIVLLLFAPFIAVIHRQTPDLLLPISLSIYLLAMIFRVNFPAWPVGGGWTFNPLCWQLMFVLGFLMAREEGVGGWVRRKMIVLRRVALPVVVATSVIMIALRLGHVPKPGPDANLLFVLDRPYLSPPHLIQFLCLALLLAPLFPRIRHALPRLTNWASKLGRNWLPVFCVGSLLSLTCQIIRAQLGGHAALDFILVSTGVILLTATAAFCERKYRPASLPYGRQSLKPVAG